MTKPSVVADADRPVDGGPLGPARVARMDAQRVEAVGDDVSGIVLAVPRDRGRAGGLRHRRSADLVVVAVEDTPDDRTHLGGRRRPRDAVAGAVTVRGEPAVGGLVGGDGGQFGRDGVDRDRVGPRGRGVFPGVLARRSRRRRCRRDTGWRRRGRSRSRRSRRPMPVVSWSTASPGPRIRTRQSTVSEKRPVRCAVSKRVVAVGREPAAERVDRPDLRSAAVARQEVGGRHPAVRSTSRRCPRPGRRPFRSKSSCCRWRQSAGARRPGRWRAAVRCRRRASGPRRHRGPRRPSRPRRCRARRASSGPCRCRAYVAPVTSSVVRPGRATSER